MSTWLAVSLWSIVAFRPVPVPLRHRPLSAELSAAPAADYFADAFDRFPLVAFSEPRHGARGTREFVTSLVRHPRFVGTVNDLVVEFGNARYQDIADRYVAGLVKAFADAREANGAELSLARARLVVDWLVTRGISGERLEPRGCGSSRALWVGHTEQERAANRKAELVRISNWADCELCNQAETVQSRCLCVRSTSL